MDQNLIPAFSLQCRSCFKMPTAVTGVRRLERNAACDSHFRQAHRDQFDFEASEKAFDWLRPLDVYVVSASA